jgi:hypothetical protein
VKFRLSLAAVVLLAGARGVAAQTVVTPEPKLPPEKQMVSDAIYRLRDSLLLVDAAGARFARDRNQASDASMQSRSRLMATRCRNALLTADSTKARITAGGQPTPDPRGVRTRMEKAIGQLGAKLSWCDTEFARLGEPANSEELRGYAIGRAEQVSASVKQFIVEIDYYLNTALGTRYRPSVRGAGSVASGALRQ